MAEQFNQHGYDFYALDLRKYGRSKLPHQKFYYLLDLREYDAEISKALEIIGQENHNQVLLQDIQRVDSLQPYMLRIILIIV
jgi:alpha-beta hydrolase superfamily lysophospholipase